jgi:ABC-2 type transport system ATP-binding protein
MPLIEVQNLLKTYGSFKALDRISFTLEKGVHGLIGPNGAGKTTTLKILLGLVASNGGEARVFGLDCRRNTDEILKRSGVLHENPRVPNWVTGREFLSHVAKLKGANPVDKEVEATAKMAEIAGALDKSVGAYSAGMVQRVALAASLIGDPELIFLDEPTSNLDPLGRIDVWNMVRELWKERGTNFLISTHALFELEKACGDVVILHRGKVLDVGSIGDLTKKYASKEYSVRVDNSSAFIEYFGKRKGVKIIAVEGGDVFLAVDDEEGFFREVSQMVREGRFVLRDVKSKRFTLEDIFVEALRRKGEE